MEGKDVVKQRLISNALELFSKHYVKQDEMFKWIRDAIVSSVANHPNNRILYNATYGGFGLSEEFEAFINADENFIYDELREQAPKYMQAFGQHVLNKPEFAGLREYLYAYETSDLHKAAKAVIAIYHDRPKLTNLAKNTKELDAYLSNPNASCGVKPTEFKPQVSHIASKNHITPSWFSKYNRVDLKVVQAQAREGSYKRELEANLAKHEETAVSIIGRETLDDFLEHYADVQKYTVKRDVVDSKTFIALLQEKGYKNDLSIWNTQTHINVSILTYIIKRNVRPTAPLQADILSRIEETFGLVCAGGTLCELKIAEIPAGLSWRIREYDGLETVYVV